MAITVNKITTNNSILTGSSVDLVASRNMTRNFGFAEDYVELHIEDPAGKNLYSIVPFMNYQIPGTYQPIDTPSIQELDFDPSTDLTDLGISYGSYILTYNILRPKIVKNYSLSFFIKEISDDRTEIRLSTSNISNTDIENNALDFIIEFQNEPYFKEFYINFGKNNLLPAINIALDKNTDPYSILIKLLNPLPIQYVTNTLVNIVDKISNTQQFSAELTTDPIIATFPTLRGPNFDLNLDNLRVGPTPYYNFTEVTSFRGNFAPQLQQLLGQLSASNFSINVDYTDYENFVHYSSAARRLEGFKYKLTNIELYTELYNSASIAATTGLNPTAQLDAVAYQNKINSTIQSFDGWEQYMYYQSESYAWPKQNSTKPYINYSVTSSQGQIWYSGNYDSASLYDDNNQNYILYTLPGYINENDNNELAFKFVASIGQMFDDIWIHIKAITDLYQAKNSLTEGISKDLVYFALQSMGINVYNDQDGNNVFQYLYGVDSNGNYLPATSSYETLVTASQYQISGQDQQKGIYKRLYSNLPLLLKSKGTTRFVQYLNTIFGIPSTVMSYIEYGGADKVTSSFEYEFDRYTYALVTDSNSGSFVNVPWVYVSQSLNRTGYNDIAPDAVEFRFKAFSTSSTDMIANFATQSLFGLDDGSQTNIAFNLIYTQTGSDDSIYSGSVGEFGYFTFGILGASNYVTSSTIPVFTTGSDGETSWYNVLIQRRYPNRQYINTSDQQYYDFYVKNNIWGEVGHITSGSLYVDGTVDIFANARWYDGNAGNQLCLGYTPNTLVATPFSGSLQELRIWSNYISESAFDSHVLNPESIEGNYTSSAYDDLAARFALGNDLYTYNHTLTSSVASVAPDQFIQSWTASFNNFAWKNNYIPFTETYYADVANSGYTNPVVDKIRIYSGSEYGTQLMPNKSIEVPPLIPITKDIHLLDASLSPQDEIDRDIIANLGSLYNIDDFIGDPTGTGYNELTKLRVEYFKKYINKYNYKDYIRLIDFFHNSLFRTLKDFTPARTNLATGIVIKPHLLERSNEEIGDPIIERENNLSQSIDTLFITSSNGGGYNQPTYSYTIDGHEGPVTLTSDARDFYTGELPSASIFIHDDFDAANINPYIYFESDNTSSYSQSLWNDEFNPLLNNVSQNQISSRRQTITLIGGDALFTSGSTYVTESIQYQDFTDTYARHTRGRYEGSEVTSVLYNQYTQGDSSYGKTAAIDSNTIRFAFFSEAIATGSSLLAMPERTNLYIRYLIDASGSLTELTKRNYDTLRENQKSNLYEVQRMFKAGEVVNVGLFDSQNPSRQGSLDGNKTIFAGGFRYDQLLYRTSSTDTLIYTLDPSVFPNGALPSVYPVNQFSASASNTNTYYTNIWLVTITHAGGPVASDTYISYNYIVDNVTSTGTATMYATQNTTQFYITLGNPIVNNITVYPVATFTPTLTNNYDTIIIDRYPFLTLDPVDNTIISASAFQSAYYPGFLYTSSIYLSLNNESTGIDRNFTLNKGDLVRFSSGSTLPKFIPQEEYEIVDVYLPTYLGQPLTFKVNRSVNYVCTEVDTLGNRIIPLYVFSNKTPDETNIVINHRKQPGQTSSGIAKNANLSLDIDNQVANITGELKTGVLSTVLIP